MVKSKITEDIGIESDLLLKLTAIPEADIFNFMDSLRGGTYFNMGMYSLIKPSKAYKPSIRIYKVVNLAAVVSGVNYENIATTKDYRDATGEAPAGSWYNHVAGYENKVGEKKSDTTAKYILWNIKQGTNTWVGYYVVDIATGAITPISKEGLLKSSIITDTEKKKLTPTAPTGYDTHTGELVENKTVWRTASFEHVFWLSQGGETPREYGMRFIENLQKVTEGAELFFDINAAKGLTNIDDILLGKTSIDTKIEESQVVTEAPVMFLDKNIESTVDVDELLSKKPLKPQSRSIEESYRRITHRGAQLTDNPLFVDFD